MFAARPSSPQGWIDVDVHCEEVVRPSCSTPRKQLLRRKLKTLRQKLRRRELKIKSMTELLKSCSDKQFIDQNEQAFLERNFSGLNLDIIKNEFSNRFTLPKGRRYSDPVKEFAMTLYYYSPKAYNYVRGILHLPHQSSLQNWCQSVNCQPGFLSEVFAHLKEMVTGNSGVSDCALFIDSMSIRKQIIYDRAKGTYVVYVNTGTAVLQDVEIAATEALVFLLVGLKEVWKFPIAYFLVDHVSINVQIQLVRMALSLCADSGLRVWSITCDGTAANIDMMSKLGCKFGYTFDDIIPVFKHTTETYDVYVIFDVCHMAELARNALGDVKEFHNGNAHIKWEFFTKLFDLQQAEGIHLANKLSINHVNWHNHKMKVKLAVQTLSSSVADALQFLMEIGQCGFLTCEETIKFIRFVDRLFDILNSRSAYGRGYKRALTATNIDYLQEVAEDLCRYLLLLKLPGDCLIISSRRRTFVLGFCTAVKSTFSIARELISSGSKFVPTYKFSQDCIEIFFSCIRQCGGWNNNPNVVQFMGSFRQLLFNNSVTASKVVNCMAPSDYITSPLFCLKWSRRHVISNSSNNDSSDDQAATELLVSLNTGNMSKYRKNVLFYMAGFVARKLRKNVACESCLNCLFFKPQCAALTDHGYYSCSVYARFFPCEKQGWSYSSCFQVYQVVCICDSVLNACVASLPSLKFAEKRLRIPIVVRKVFANPSLCKYFHNDCALDVDLLTESTHSVNIVKSIADNFFYICLFAKGKQMTQSLNKSLGGSKRYVYNKLILFQHQ
jgi:hypothetical protein